MKSRTQDEKFLISLYLATEQHPDKEGVFNRFEIGHSASLHPKGVNTICKLLLQANFIKKSGEEGIYITENGISLAKRLLDET